MWQNKSLSYLARIGLFLSLASVVNIAFADSANGYPNPTYSSPIALSKDNRLLWSVNPQDDTVSIIRTDTQQLLTNIRVGDEPQSIALSPDGRYAYIANAAGKSVTVIWIKNTNIAGFLAIFAREIITGAEPWNIAISPDGHRVFVANSGQDTITVIDAINGHNQKVIGHVDLRNSICNKPDQQRHFQPRGLAVTKDNSKLLVTSFFAFTKPGGQQATDNGRQGVVCRLNINTHSTSIAGYKPVSVVKLASRVTGFKIDANGDTVPDDTSAFPNQMQSIVIRGNNAYLPNIAASPTGPLKFNVDTQAFVNILGGVNGGNLSDFSFINLHLGARNPEPGKPKLFFANPWAIAFSSQSGAGKGYAVSAGSDLLVKVRVNANGTLSNTVDADTTRFIDLNNPANPVTKGRNACKNPLGIAISNNGAVAYVICRVSKNIAVVDLTKDKVALVIKTGTLPPPWSLAEEIAVGAEMFFSSRGHFDRPNGTKVSTENRLSSEGWQNCASCHFEGLTDSVVWAFGTGPRKSVPLNGTFNPRNPTKDQRVLNYSAIFDEVEDFELNIRNVSGPGPLAPPTPPAACSNPAQGSPATSTFDPNHGLLIGDNGNINLSPCVVVAFNKPNANRKQLTVTLPGSAHRVPALTALKKWVQFAVRTPYGPLPNSTVANQIQRGRVLFGQAGCAKCHNGGKWTNSTKNFVSPPALAQISTETDPNAAGVAPDPNTSQYLFKFLADIGSFNLNVPGSGNAIPNRPLIGGREKDQVNKDALGFDHDNDGKGDGFNTTSLLGIYALPPYLHNGACESLACVVADVKHRTNNRKWVDRLAKAQDQAAVVKFLESINAKTQPF
jgi:YVTN family beta-propeller protein